MRKKGFLAVLCAVVLLAALGSPCFGTENGIEWTAAERDFILEHPVIRLGVDPEFVPYEFIDESGEYKGIAADYLALLSERTGLTFEVAKNLT